ncbi:MAG TPA: transaldolase family protein [Acidobacteriaceae bacterium]|nr:transaldolase family protein [Acidobacteriaceae bacterium]
MKIFLDSANLQDVESGLARGHLSGITTNPSLLAKEPKSNFYGHIKKIVSLMEADGRNLPLSVEVFATKPDEMIAQAQDILQQIPYAGLNIKVPIGWDELKVIYALAKLGIRVNCTCIFTEEQCVLAANSGASYVSIFHCRLKDIGGDPVRVIENTRSIFDQAGHKAEIIVGSIRMQTDILEAHLAGGHIVTAGAKIIEQMSAHPATDKSVQGFLKDFAGWMQ